MLDINLGKTPEQRIQDIIGSFKETLENSTEIEIRGKKCRIITLDALIKSKESLGRQKDKEAVVILKALLEKAAKSYM